jgi:hypothetical protein
MTSVSVGPCTVINGYSTDHIPGQKDISLHQLDGANLDSNGIYHAHDDSQWLPDGMQHIGTVTPYHSGSFSLILFNPGSSDGDVAVECHVEACGPNKNIEHHDRFVAMYQGAGVNPTSTPDNLCIVRRIIGCRQFSELGPTLQFQDHAGYQTSAVHNSEQTGDGNSPIFDVSNFRRIANLPLRGSIRIRNVTEAMAVGGIVRVLRLNGGIQLNRDSAGAKDKVSDYWEVDRVISLCDTIRDSKRTKVFNGHEMNTMKQSNSYPVDFSSSMMFRKDQSIFQAIANPAYSTVAILIDDFVSSSGGTGGLNNSYELNLNVQRACRFDPSSVLGGMMTTMRVNAQMHGQIAGLESESTAAKNATDTLRKKVGA